MRAILRGSVVLAVAATLIGCAPDAPVPTAIPDAPLLSAVGGGQEENIRVPVEIDVFIECALGGAGELVSLFGNLHIRNDILFDGNGGVHVRSHFQPQGINGVGATSGDKYQATGITRSSLNLKVGVTETTVNNFRIIGQGPGNNFLIHVNTHFTLNANGVITAVVDNATSSCR